MTGLPGVSGEVIRISFDYAVTLSLEGGGEIRIEAPFVLSTEGRLIARVDPVSIGEAASDVLSLLHLRVEAADVTDGGVLSIRLAGSRTVAVEPDERYEAWSYTDRSGVMAVCSPGGSVTTWGIGDGSP